MIPIKERFDAKWIPEPNSGCWLWTGSVIANGYGTFWLGAMRLAHRVAWSLYRGEIPKSSHVLHRCDTPPCVNPNHLFLGTQSDNNRDREAKGRGRYFRGENHNMAKLTKADAIMIRDSNESTSALVRKFNVGRWQIWRIRTGRNWKHMGGKNGEK